MKSFFLLFTLLIAFAASGQEVCNNGVDDDGDGKIDLNDPDCSCGAAAAVTSIIPNPSFEVKSGCPSSFSQLNLATPWIQATDATSDYINSCGFVFPAIVDAGLTNFPDGDGITGAHFIQDYNEYLGTTLLSPMVAGTNYQLTFNIAGLMIHNNGTTAGVNVSILEPVDVTLFGCVNGSNLPISTMMSPNLTDPTWVEIAHASYTPTSTWGEISMFFTPTVNINAVMLGAPNVLPISFPTLSSSSDYPYVLFDNLLLNTAAAFGINVSQSGFFCNNNLILNANLTTAVSPAATFQWYHDGVAIVGATTLTYNVPSVAASLGTYSIKVTDGTTCFISTRVTVNNTIPSPAYTVIKPTCIVTTGTITITDPAAQYSFDNGVTWQVSPIKSGLNVGTYYIKIKTATGCISSSTGVVIAAPQLLNTNDFTVVQPTVCGGTGTITFTAPNAVSYSFDNGVTWTTNPVAANLAAGTYFIKIKDALGCESASQYVMIYPIYLGYPTYTAVQPDCTTGGTITINTVGDQYSFDGGVTWSTNPVATNLPPGSYSIMVKTGTGCISYTNYVYLNTFYLPYPDYTKVQPFCGVGGSLTFTTVASEYSFDGGLTWSPNPVANNLTVGSYALMVRNGLGCVSYPTYVYLDELFLAKPTYTMVLPTCEIIGNITITTPAAEYSFDNGITWSPNPSLTITMGNSYQIRIKSVAGCISGADYIYAPNYYLPNPAFTVSHPFCKETTGVITITPVAGYSYSFDNGVTYQLSNVSNPLLPGNYYVTVKNAIGCESQAMYIYINPPSGIPSAPSGNSAQLYCIFNSPTVSFLTASGANIQWYASATSATPLSNTTPLITGMTYYATQTVNTCESPVRYPVTVTLSSFIIPAADFESLVCDDLNNGNEVVDLSDYNAGLVAVPTDYNFAYYTTLSGAENQTAADQISNPTNYNLPLGVNIIYARLLALNGCYRVVALKLTVIPSPFVTMNDSYILCQNTTIALIADAGYDAYLWSTGQTSQIITINAPGDYWVTVTENHAGVACTTTKNITVKPSNPATITNVVTSDWTDYNNTITVLISDSSIGDYEYSLDGVHYQDSPNFYGLASGDYRAYVRDKNNCGVVDKEVFLLMYPKYFTPNGDTYNDTWKIRLSEFEVGFTIKIFDRHGKFLKQLGNNMGWDGILNDKELPATDYWFLVTRSNGKEYRGHFALKR
jgi:gliding motility-associated-like protein